MFYLAWFSLRNHSLLSNSFNNIVAPFDVQVTADVLVLVFSRLYIESRQGGYPWGTSYNVWQLTPYNNYALCGRLSCWVYAMFTFATLHPEI